MSNKSDYEEKLNKEIESRICEMEKQRVRISRTFWQKGLHCVGDSCNHFAVIADYRCIHLRGTDYGKRC